jgi:hypothetical protein
MTFSLISPALLRTEQVITWIAVEHPKLDIVGLVLGAFSAAAFFVLSAMGLGVIFGITLILRRRRQPDLHTRLDLVDHP